MTHARPTSQKSSSSSETAADRDGSSSPSSTTREQGPLQAAGTSVELGVGERSPQTERGIQPKLTVAEPSDKYEKEAERVADAVMRMSDTGSEGRHDLGDGRRSQRSSGGQVGKGEMKQWTESPEDSGNPLSSSLRSFFEPRFGRDFSDVRVHADSDSFRMNRMLGAQAFTYGRDIYFGPGEHSPGTRSGKRLLAHELTHTIQQGESAKKSDGVQNSDAEARTLEEDGRSVEIDYSSEPFIQRLIKNEHPWTGVVVDTPLLALRDAPKNEANTLADLPSDTLVKVLDETRGWLNLQVDTSQKGLVINSRGKSKISGGFLSGYSFHEYVDDAVAEQMSEMMGEKAEWAASGPPSLTDPDTTFAKWASAPKETDPPPLVGGASINCWEMILLAGYKSGAVDWKSIHNLYTSGGRNWFSRLEKKLIPGSRTKYSPKTKGDLERGDIVLFDGVSHVTLATGNGDKVLTFWPPPKGLLSGPEKVKKSTVSALKKWMENNLSPSQKAIKGPGVQIAFGSPDWTGWR